MTRLSSTYDPNMFGGRIPTGPYTNDSGFPIEDLDRLTIENFSGLQYRQLNPTQQTTVQGMAKAEQEKIDQFLKVYGNRDPISILQEGLSGPQPPAQPPVQPQPSQGTQPPPVETPQRELPPEYQQFIRDHPDLAADPFGELHRTVKKDFLEKAINQDPQYFESLDAWMREHAKQNAMMSTRTVGKDTTRADQFRARQLKDAADIARETFFVQDLEKTPYSKYVDMYSRTKKLVETGDGIADEIFLLSQEFKDQIREVPEEDRELFLRSLQDMATEQIHSTAGGLGWATTLQRSVGENIENVGSAAINTLEFLNSLNREDFSERLKQPLAKLKNENNFITAAREIMRGADPVVGESYLSKSIHGAAATLPYMLVLQATMSQPAKYFTMGGAMLQSDLQKDLEQAGVSKEQAFPYAMATAIAQSAIEKLSPGELKHTPIGGMAFREWAKTEAKRIGGELTEEALQGVTELAEKILAETTSNGTFEWSSEWSKFAEQLKMAPGVIGIIQGGANIPSAAHWTGRGIDAALKNRLKRAHDELLATLPEQVQKDIKSDDPDVRLKANLGLPNELIATLNKESVRQKRALAQFRQAMNDALAKPVEGQEEIGEEAAAKAEELTATAHQKNLDYLNSAENAARYLYAGVEPEPESQVKGDSEAGLKLLDATVMRPNVSAAKIREHNEEVGGGLPSVEGLPNGAKARNAFVAKMRDISKLPLEIQEDIARRVLGTEEQIVPQEGGWRRVTPEEAITTDPSVELRDTPFGPYAKSGALTEADRNPPEPGVVKEMLARLRGEPRRAAPLVRQQHAGAPVAAQEAVQAQIEPGTPSVPEAITEAAGAPPELEIVSRPEEGAVPTPAPPPSPPVQPKITPAKPKITPEEAEALRKDMYDRLRGEEKPKITPSKPKVEPAPAAPEVDEAQPTAGTVEVGKYTLQAPEVTEPPTTEGKDSPVLEFPEVTELPTAEDAAAAKKIADKVLGELAAASPPAPKKVTPKQPGPRKTPKAAVTPAKPKAENAGVAYLRSFMTEKRPIEQATMGEIDQAVKDMGSLSKAEVQKLAVEFGMSTAAKESKKSILTNIGLDLKRRLEFSSRPVLGLKSTEEVREADEETEVVPEEKESEPETEPQTESQQPITGQSAVVGDRPAISEVGQRGKTGILSTADGIDREVTYYAVEADDITPSHDARKNYRLNPGGDENVRFYHDPKQSRKSRDVVEEIATANKKLPQLTSDTLSAVDGPPMTAPDGSVLGGNARSMGVQLGYSKGGDVAARIKAEMVRSAAKFGIDSAAVEAMKNPIIIRVLTNPGNRGELSAILNDALTAGMTRETVGASRGRRVSTKTVEMVSKLLEPDEKGESPTLRSVLGNPIKANGIVDAFRKDGVWTDSELEGYTDENHNLNEDGKTAIENTLLGMVINDPTILGSVSKAVRQKVMSSLNALTRGINSATEGPRFAEIIRNAVEAYDGYKASGKPLRQYFMQQTSFLELAGLGDQSVAHMVDALDKLGPRQFREYIEDIVRSFGVAIRTPGRTLFDLSEESEGVSADQAVAQATEARHLRERLLRKAGEKRAERDEVKADIKKKIDDAGSTLTSGVNPDILLDLVHLASLEMQLGMLDFAVWVADFVKNVGESKIREIGPLLQEAWRRAKRENLELGANEPESVDEIIDRGKEEAATKEEEPVKEPESPIEEPVKEPEKEPESPPDKPNVPKGETRLIELSDLLNIKKDAVDDRRLAQNASLVDRFPRRGRDDLFYEARALIVSDPLIADTIIKTFQENEGTIREGLLSGLEQVVLQIKLSGIEASIDEARTKLKEAKENKDAVATDEMQRDILLMEQATLQLELILDKAGTMASEAFLSRQDVEDDISSAETMFRNLTNGVDDMLLTEEERKKLEEEKRLLREKLERIAQFAKDWNKRAEEVEKAGIIAIIDDDIADIKKEKKKPRDKVTGGKNVKRDKARKSLHDFAEKYRTQFFSVSASPEMVADAVKVIVNYLDYLAEEVTSFLDLMSRLKRDMPPEFKSDEARPVFKEAWDKIREKGEAPAVEDVDAVDREELSRMAKKLMRWAIESGIPDRESVVDAVHEEMQQIVPGITRWQTIWAMSNYGLPLNRQLPMDPVSMRYRAIKGELLQLSKLHDMQILKKSPQATGLERPIPEEDERLLIKLVNEAKKAGGYEITDDRQHLKSALATAKTALRNYLNNLAEEIIYLKRKARHTLQEDDELKEMRRVRKELKSYESEVFPKLKTDEERLAAIGKALDRAIENLKGQIETRDIQFKPKKEQLTDPVTDAKRARLSALKATRELMRATDPQYQMEKLLRENSLYEAALKNRYAKLKERNLQRDFEAKAAKTRLPLTEEAKQLLFEYKQEQKKYRILKEAWRQKQLQGYDKAWDFTLEALRAQRTIITSIDFSALSRQGWFVTMGHPLKTMKIFWDVVRPKIGKNNAGATWTEKAISDAHEEIRNNPIYQFAVESKLDMTEAGPVMTRGEEEYQSRWLHVSEQGDTKLSKAKRVLKYPFLASERAFTAQLNKQRMFLFESLVNTLAMKPGVRGGKITLEEGKMIANFVNIVTGRGNLGRAEAHASLLAAIFFSPKFVWSRFQILSMSPVLFTRHAELRKMFLKEYVRTLAGAAVMYGVLGLISGLLYDDDDEDKPTVTFDPYSSGFGKLRMGNMWFDLLGGFSQLITLGARIMPFVGGVRANVAGAHIPIRGPDVPHGGITAEDIMFRFARSKFAPAIGSGFDFFAGEDVLGREWTPGTAAANLLIAMAPRDIMDILGEDLKPVATTLGVLGTLIGANAAVYQDGDISDFYAQRYLLEKNKKEQKGQFKDDRELHIVKRTANLMRDLRKLAKDQEAAGKDTIETNLYMNGAARFATEKKEIPRYPNPLSNVEDLPPEVREVVYKHLASTAYALARTKDVLGAKPDTIEAMESAREYLKATGVDPWLLVDLLMAKMANEGAGPDARSDWRGRLLMNLQ